MTTEALSPADQAAKEAAKEIKRLSKTGGSLAAIAHGEEWLKNHPAHPRVLCSLASAHSRNGNPDAARALFKQTLEIDSKDVVAKFLLAFLDLKQGNFLSGIRQLAALNRNGFNEPSMGLLKRLAEHGIATVTYRQLFRMMEATGAIPQKQLPYWEINPSITETANPQIPLKLMQDLEEEVGHVARSQIFQACGRIPQPINTDAFVVAHNRRPFFNGRPV